ncbi:MAG: hypothetical protein HFH72_08315 [Lachnospiraceae bacterium]|nr:hypothetical protein [Lachnospiraceae bacterium]
MNRHIYCPDGRNDWEKDTFMTPHAMLIRPGVIRIWGGVRDGSGISRIKYIDVDENHPNRILFISERPCLDIGNNGCFDDNGVILGDILQVNDDTLYMYYVGFQHVQKVKFFAFSGLAVSTDCGQSFERYMETPILDRTEKARYGRCIHTVLYDEGIFKCYYAIINDWKVIQGIPYPVYNIWYLESKDGIHFSDNDRFLCVDTENDEYRIGRPKVYKSEKGYEMYYTRDLISKEYIAGYAFSEDGIHWTRQDHKIALVKSGEAWDSEMACYPVKLVTTNHKYLFYNGNGMGRTGVGYMRI